jgi:hypothetical protein
MSGGCGSTVPRPIGRCASSRQAQAERGAVRRQAAWCSTKARRSSSARCSAGSAASSAAFRRAYIEQGKGNGKSPLAGGIGLFLLMADGEAGAEIYAAGATKDQAGILFRDAIKMRDKSPDIRARTKTSGGEGKEYNLAYLAKGSFFRPISREAKRTGSGPRPHGALCDEVHEHPDRGVMEMLERGFKFRQQPLLLMTRTAGPIATRFAGKSTSTRSRLRPGSHRCARRRREVPRPSHRRHDVLTFAGWIRRRPAKRPECWPKANPLLGVTITEDYLAGNVAQAQGDAGEAERHPAAALLPLDRRRDRMDDAGRTWSRASLSSTRLSITERDIRRARPFAGPRHHREGVGVVRPAAWTSKSRSTARSRSSASPRSMRGSMRGRPATRWRER